MEITTLKFTVTYLQASSIKIIRQSFSSHLSYSSNLFLASSDKDLMYRQLLVVIFCNATLHKVGTRHAEKVADLNNKAVGLQ